MLIETFHRKLPSGRDVKFSIWKRQIKARDYYYAMVVGVDLDSYKDLHEQVIHYGVDVIGDDGQTVFYSDSTMLKEDLLIYYEIAPLKSEL